MSSPHIDDPFAAESARLATAYAKRKREYFWTSLGHVFGHQERERNTLSLLSRHGFMPIGDRSILELGCGSGTWIQQFIRWGARADRITGVDVRPGPLAKARATLPDAVRLDQANAAALPYADASFDIVLQATMFTSVLDQEVRRCIAAEMVRVLKPDGLIIWYDFWMNNPRNPDVSGVRKREIVSLFSGCHVDLRKVTLVPPVMRWLAAKSWLLAYTLSHFPPLCTHYLGVITKLARLG